MKKYFQKIVDFIETLGRAKAAAHLSRMGKHAEARALMLAD